jgi:uncharacterized repeat protein (TIGR03943 family)
MNRQAQAIVLFLLGGTLLHTGFTGIYLRYVKAGLRPLLLAAGIILIAAATATIWYEWRSPHPPDKDHPDHHPHHEPGISWLLLPPLLALILITPPALGPYTASRTGMALQHPWNFPTLPASDPLHLTVVDYAARAVYDHGRSLGSRQITITGFITVDHNGTPYLTRMFLSCCAADAQPIKIGLTGQIPPILQPGIWFEILGTYTSKQTKDPINNAAIPFINITQATSVPAPQDQYDT